jgi:UDP-glucose 4-epimerase
VTAVPEGLTGQRAVVTGGAGFIGSHIADRLTPACEVCVLDRLSSGSVSNLPAGVSLTQGDVRDRQTLDRVVDGADVIFHEAGLVSVAESVASPEESHDVNATGTLRVLESARRADARVVLASSAAVYGVPAEVPIAETQPKAPTSPYGLDKLAADHYARLYADLYGLETVALRYFNVYGPGQSGDYAGVIGTFLDQARAGGPLTVHGAGTQTRDFVHVEDVVDANLAAAVTDATGRAFNVGTGRAHSIADLARIVRDLAGTAPAVTHTDAREGDIPASRADISRSRRVLGYEPSIELRTGIRRLLD